MQGLADGYFIIPVCLANYLSQTSFAAVSETALKKSKEEQKEKIDKTFKSQRGSFRQRHSQKIRRHSLESRGGWSETKKVC